MSLLFPLIASSSVLATGAAGGYYATYAVRSQWLGRSDWRGRTDTGAVALTFDDGPTDDTQRVLDVLAKRNLRATFFMVGQQVESFRGIAERVVAEGHEAGNHSYSHPIFLYRSPNETRWQLEHTQRLITDTTGVRPRFARPPCGVRSPSYFQATRALNLRTVQWDVAGFDWKRRNAQRIACDVLRDVRPGSIILLHDGDSDRKRDRRQTVEALPLIIGGLDARGLRVEPLAKLLTQ